MKPTSDAANVTDLSLIEKISTDVRANIVRIRDTYALSWQDVGEILSAAAKMLPTENRERAIFLAEKNAIAWRKITIEMSGARLNISDWKIIDLMVEQARKNLASPTIKSTSSIFQQIIVPTAPKPAIRFGVFPCQDTILPLFFKYSYNRNLDVEFVEYDSWGQCLDAFEAGEIHCALHDFSTAVSASIVKNEEFFFWPYFNFNGYGVFVRKSSVDTYAASVGLAGYTFAKLPNAHKKAFIEQCSGIFAETLSDMEWTARLYFNRFGMDDAVVSEKLIPCDITTGKLRFTGQVGEAAEGDIYITNSTHILDLTRDEYKNDYELIAAGTKLTDHKNFNGLICSMKFFEQQPETIRELIYTWFNDVRTFNKELAGLRFTKDQKTTTLNYLPDFLNERTQSHFTLGDLLDSYYYDEFYETPEKAFNEFYNHYLQQEEKIKPYFKMIQSQTNRIGEIDINSKIQEFASRMRGE